MAPSATGLVGVHGFDLARDAAVELQVPMQHSWMLFFFYHSYGNQGYHI
jgi:hypothetical protein